MEQDDVHDDDENQDDSIGDLLLHNLEIADDAEVGDATEVDDLESISE